MRVLLVGTELDDVAMALTDGYEVVRAETLDAVRAELPGVSAVVVGDPADTTAAAVRETVRSGVYCPVETPVLRLGHDPDEAVAEGFDAVVPRDSPTEIESALEVAARADAYRDAVADLFEACQARGSDESDADLERAFERADRAFTELLDSTARTPYERIFGFSGESGPDDTGAESDSESESDPEDGA